VLALSPQHAHAFVEMLSCHLLTCNWERVETLAAQLPDRIADRRSIMAPFILLGLPVTAAQLLACTEHYVAHKLARVTPLPRRLPPRREGPIRLAYLSADYRRHATAFLAAGLFERHDRRRFEVLGVSFGIDDGSDMRARLERAFDRFHDVSARTDRDVATLLRDLEVDIAIDLKGHTDEARPGILAYRAAPIQVNYLGYPGTLGADFVDYVIADKIVLPHDQQPYFTEKIVHLPGCYQVNDATRAASARPWTRSDAGLPERGFVFCCFNQTWKLNRVLFDRWMRLLRAVEGSVLWLFQTNEAAAANLRREAEARGVAASRLIFARFAELPDHLARLGLADLFLDTLPCNAHTTASDALWAGVPIVTALGDTFAGRVAASLLQAVGLPELATRNLDEYEALAIRLATEPALLQATRAKLAGNRSTCSLFDTDRFCRQIEAAYAAMVDIWQRGESPRAFSLEPAAQ
jgi:protein O-GlcNAc transferase